MKAGIKDERGFVLILALVSMLAITLIGLSVVMNMTTGVQLSRNERDARQAFLMAEAGIREASARLHLPRANARFIGEKSTDANYRTTSWNAGNSLGRDFSSGTSVLGAVGDSQSYSVSIRYLDESNSEGFCDGNNVGNNDSGNTTLPPASCQRSPVEIVMYGQDFNLNSSITYIKYGKLPVYKLTSTGTSNGTTRTIVAYLGESNLNTDTEYGINTNDCVVANGTSNILGTIKQGPGCGCDPQITGTCASNKTALTDMTTYLGDTLANIKTYSDEVHTCTNATCSGPGDDIPASGNLDSVIANWGEGLSLPDGETEGVLLFIDNAGGKDVSISNIPNPEKEGEGILIVTGNLTLSGNLKWEGLIYVMGTLTLSGGGSTLNVEGGIMAGNTVTTNGGITVQYDKEELEEMARQTSTSATMVWKRL